MGLIGLAIAQSCKNWQCGNSDEASLSTASSVGTACADSSVLKGYYCNTKRFDYCSLDSETSGTCKANSTRFEKWPIKIQYPGEKCDPRRIFYECGYGYRVCSAFRCLGFLEGEKCSQSADCNPGLYCHTSTKICTKLDSSGSSCKQQSECPRDKRCLYQNAGDTDGTCVSYFSKDNDQIIYAKAEEDTLVCSSGSALPKDIPKGLYTYKTGASFVPGDYKCGKTLSSNNAGKDCTKDDDCTTNEDGVLVQCKCSYSQTSKICDISSGNTEW